MALDREIRLTERQIWYARRAAADRIVTLEKRLAKTSYEGKPGMKYAVLTELAEQRELFRVMNHNHDQIARAFAAKIEGQS